MTIILSAFIGGLLTSLSPCVFPMIPLTVGYLGKQSSKRKVLLFFFGQLMAFTLLGFLAVKLGEVFGFTSQDPKVKMIIGAFLILFALSAFFNYLPSVLRKFNQTQNDLSEKAVGKGSFLMAFILGASSALMSSPCSSPILATILFSISDTGSLVKGMLSMLSYSLGASILFLVLGLGIVKFKRLKKPGKWLSHVHHISSSLILAAGLYYIWTGVGAII